MRVAEHGTSVEGIRPFYILENRRKLMQGNKSMYPLRIGRTTYLVCVKQSESAVKPMEEVFRDICKQEALEDNKADMAVNLENNKKSS